MTDRLPPEDRPPAQWRRFTPKEEAAKAIPEDDPSNPAVVGHRFCEALEDHVYYRNALLNLTTPESHPAWGDFSEAAARYASIEDAGFGTRANYAEGASDVAYFKILSGVDESYQVLDEQIVPFAAVVTLVWRPERGMWLVHGMGDYIQPEKVPRTAP